MRVVTAVVALGFAGELAVGEALAATAPAQASAHVLALHTVTLQELPPVLRMTPSDLRRGYIDLAFRTASAADGSYCLTTRVPGQTNSSGYTPNSRPCSACAAGSERLHLPRIGGEPPPTSLKVEFTYNSY